MNVCAVHSGEVIKCWSRKNTDRFSTKKSIDGWKIDQDLAGGSERHGRKIRNSPPVRLQWDFYYDVHFYSESDYCSVPTAVVLWCSLRWCLFGAICSNFKLFITNFSVIFLIRVYRFIVKSLTFGVPFVQLFNCSSNVTYHLITIFGSIPSPRVLFIFFVENIVDRLQ